mmetsp:Transcript_17724/g.29999  ORF Transcript_17724/g.29999 Transcript_17724/m.29999 type:complete len:201 (-) Transcript_17724:233-835(-)
MTIEQEKKKVYDYLGATQKLTDEIVEQDGRVQKLVITGSASSVIGPVPKLERDHLYSDTETWPNHKEVKKPNEYMKLMGELYCWNRIGKYQRVREESPIHLTSLLPYFMVGPPLLPQLAETNSSCKAISQLIYNQQQVYPNVNLPIVDVRDVAKAHVLAALSPDLQKRTDRLMLSAESLWYEEIVEQLFKSQGEIFEMEG